MSSADTALATDAKRSPAPTLSKPIPFGRGPVPYPGHYGDVGLEPGMVVSVETAMLHPKRGFIKLEDTVAVTASGNEGLGDAGRSWNRAG